jgi:hypothetical protein
MILDCDVANYMLSVMGKVAFSGVHGGSFGFEAERLIGVVWIVLFA